uniref:NADH-ubiquinone oxidoreductase chain 2 n=1 Tax=Silvanus bidentatus TaxID=878982 RepID=A0A343A401_9CUCU|nr:NADH dehydrogenase subunit 2 [Silvanus bidentatus]AOY39279.1 NADH dehydrogenase subunit 2 [Silvanus bidentatus]
MFFSSLMISIFISISSNSWLGIWMGLEINMLSIIPLMNNTKNMYMTESSMKYFITQAMASTIILMSIILMMSNFMVNNFMLILINSSLLTKMGSAPFHFWFPEVMEGQLWSLCFTLLTIQKIIPLSILNLNLNLNLFLYFIIIFNMLISAIMGLNQTSLRKILTYSSINHIGWMIASMMFLKMIWISYFLIYSFISFNLIFMFNIFNTFYFKQLFKFLNFSYLMKLIFMMNFFSLGGLPPFLGFLPKWLTIQSMIFNGMEFLIVIMVILTLITLFYYMRLTFSTLMLSTNEIFKLPNYKIYWINFLNFSSLIFLLLSILYFNF